MCTEELLGSPEHENDADNYDDHGNEHDLNDCTMHEDDDSDTLVDHDNTRHDNNSEATIMMR